MRENGPLLSRVVDPPGLKVGRGLGIFPAGPKTPFVPGGATTRDKRAFCPRWWLHPGQKGGPFVHPGQKAPPCPGSWIHRDKRYFWAGWENSQPAAHLYSRVDLPPGTKGGPFSLIPAKSYVCFCFFLLLF